MYKQAPKSPAMKALVGNQKNLPAGLKAQIEAAPESPAKSLEIVLKKKKDGTLNEKYLKMEQDESNSKAVKKSLATKFGVKKPKANIK
jgi:hypothetical protein